MKKPASKKSRPKNLDLVAEIRASVPSIKERVQAALTTVVLVNEACASLFEKLDGHDPIVTEAFENALVKASDELYWLSLLPEKVLEMPAPTDDQKSAMAKGGA